MPCRWCVLYGSGLGQQWMGWMTGQLLHRFLEMQLEKWIYLKVRVKKDFKDPFPISSLEDLELQRIYDNLTSHNNSNIS